MNLYSYFLSNKTLPIHKNKHYFPVYERHFSKFVNRPIFFLEIGSGGGGSSQMWKRYFGPLAVIVTIDIRPECLNFSDDQVKVRIGDQSDPVFLNSLLSEFGAPDVILDDGSHQMHHVTATFQHLYHRMAPEGVYMVEDLHTAYWTDWGGGLRKPGSFIELCKHLVDELNGDHIDGPLRPPSVEAEFPADFSSTEFTHQTLSMHFYDSIVAFERGRSDAESKRSMVTGDPSLPIG